MKAHSTLSRRCLPHALRLFLGLLAALVCAPVRAQQAGPPRGVVLSPPSPTVTAWPASAKRYALIIGIDRYDDTQITTLGGAANDARTLAGALTTYAGFPAAQIVLLASDQPAERQPTRGAILRRLSNLAQVIPKDGLLLLAFAGHGIERGGEAYLLPADAQVSNDINLLEQTAINVRQVKEWVKRIGVQQVVMLLDACRNDPGGRADADNPLTKTYMRGFDFDVRNREVEAFATLYATKVGARAYEYREKHQGYFTWAVVEGLKGGAANERGEVTLESLKRYVEARVAQQVLLDLGREQRPFAVVEGYKAGDLLIAMAAPGATANRAGQTAPTQILQPATGPTNNTATDSSHTQRAARETSPLNVPRGPYAGRVYLYVSGAGELFTTSLAQKLSEQGLSTTLAVAAGSNTTRLHAAIAKLRAGDKTGGRALPFALIVTGALTVTPRPQFVGLYVAVAEGSLAAIATADARTVASELITDARGFGNTQAQADDNALKAAAAAVSQSFITRIAAAAAR